ncbi:hypothetical protein C0J52_14664 [Blattella germanica]|nr:hypothetical protein C0J52_14664 [Blattella germanica]
MRMLPRCKVRIGLGLSRTSFYVMTRTTKQQNGSQVFEGQQRGGREAWMQEEDSRFANTPPDGQFPMQNGGYVKFEVPKVPVIFVLGEFLLMLFQFYNFLLIL